MASIEPFTHRKIIVLLDDATANQAAHAMRDKRIGCVIVSDHSAHIVGIVTDRDLANEVLAEKKSANTPLSEVMTPDPVVVDESADISRVVYLMEQYGIRRVPVIRTTTKNRQRCVGLVTLDDLIASKSVDYYHLMRIVRSQVLRRTRPGSKGRPWVLRTVLPGPIVEAADETVETFYRVISHHVGISTRLDQSQVEALTRIILSAFTRRLHHTGAMRLVVHLPKRLQQEYLDLPPGPDHSVSAAAVLSEVKYLLEVDDAKVAAVMACFCLALEDLIEERELEQMKAQLPKDLRAFFSVREETQPKKSAA